MSDLPTSPAAFKAASEWLSGTPAAASLPNDIKLELYGVYKTLTTGAPNGSRPSIFYPTARAKYDAWVAGYAKYSNGEGEQAARERYIAIAGSVGWKGEGLEEDDGEIDFDEEEDDEHDEDETDTRPKKDGGGLGPRVSGLETQGATDQDAPLHDAVVNNDIEGTKRLLSSEPHSVNAKDEFGNTPLHLAVDRGHGEIVKTLLSSGADRTIEDEDGQTPLQIAEMLSRTDIIALLQ